MAESVSRASKSSLASLREKVSQLPRRRLCHWVGQWFTFPQLATKTLSACLSIISVSLILSWESQGVTVHDLDTPSFQFRGRVLTFMVVGCITIVYAVTMVTVGLVGVKVHAKVLTALSGLVLLLWLFSAPVMSATVTELRDSKFARWRGVDVTQLEVATGLGFLCMVVVMVDILLAFNQLTRWDTDTAKFSMEVESSRSTIQAVKSGQSMPMSVTSSTLRQRSSRTSTQRQSSYDRVAMEMEEATLVSADDDPTGLDEDSTWEAISHEVIPLTSSFT